MPDQTNQNNTTPQTPAPSGTPPNDTTPPAVIPDFQVADIPSVPTDSTPTVSNDQPTLTGDDSGSATIPDLPPVISPSSPKKKFGTGKIIATILGFLILTGGIVGGVVLTQQQQDIRERAKECVDEDCDVWVDVGGSAHGEDDDGELPESQDSGDEINEATGGGGGGGSGGGGGGPTGIGGGSGGTTYNTETQLPWIPEGYDYSQAHNTGATQYGDVGWDCDGAGSGGCPGEWDSDLSGYYTWPPGSDNYYPIDVTPDDDGGGEEGGGETTVPPGVTGSCQNVKAYTTTWTQMTSTQLSGLGANDQVNLCVAGTVTIGSFQKGRFTINGTQQPETTTIRPGSTNEFCQLYTVPAGTTSFNVTAQVFHPTIGWK